MSCRQRRFSGANIRTSASPMRREIDEHRAFIG